MIQFEELYCCDCEKPCYVGFKNVGFGEVELGSDCCHGQIKTETDTVLTFDQMMTLFWEEQSSEPKVA